MRLKALCYRAATPGLRLWHRLRHRDAADAVAIVMMHGVHDDAMAAAVPPPRSSTPIEVFEANVRALARQCPIVSLDEAVERLARRQVGRGRCAVLTFDDSLKSLAELAAPRLASLGLPATIFISTDVIETQKPYWWRRLEFAVARAHSPAAAMVLPGGGRFTPGATRGPESLSELKRRLRTAPAAEREAIVESVERHLGAVGPEGIAADPHAAVLTWEDVRQIARLGLGVGSHTVTHAHLAALPEEAMRFELESSRRMIEQQVQAPCRHCAYPYGGETATVRAAARAAGYVSAVTTIEPGWNRPGDDLFGLRRFGMPREAGVLPAMLWRAAPPARP